MVAAVKEICIFVMIAQAVMFFVPSNSYMKYVRILVGVMMILKITEPVFGLFLDEEREKEISRQIMLFSQEMNIADERIEIEEYGMGIYESIEEELKNRLNQCKSGYEIKSVELSDEQKIIVTLEDQDRVDRGIQIKSVVIGAEKDEAEQTGKENEKEELKEVYGSCLGVDAERIVIVTN